MRLLLALSGRAMRAVAGKGLAGGHEFLERVNDGRPAGRGGVGEAEVVALHLSPFIRSRGGPRAALFSQMGTGRSSATAPEQIPLNAWSATV